MPYAKSYYFHSPTITPLPGQTQLFTDEESHVLEPDEAQALTITLHTALQNETEAQQPPSHYINGKRRIYAKAQQAWLNQTPLVPENQTRLF